MSDKLDLTTLASRPPWRVVKIFLWLAIITATFSLLSFVLAGIMMLQASMLSSSLDTTDADSSISLDISDFLLEAAWSGLGLLFYAGVFWLCALGVDKLDQLVWLKASEEDRLHIYNQRKKKKRK